MSLDGRIVLVTGGSRGIGRAIALRLARDGADVFIKYRSQAQAAKSVADEIEALGRRAWTVAADVRKFDDIRAMFEQIRGTTGKLDILINNAALGSPKGSLEIRPNQWDMTQEICARSVLLCSQQAAALMSGGCL